MKRNLVIVFLHLLFWAQNIARNLTFFGYNAEFELVCDQLLIASICYINYFFIVPYILRKNTTLYYILGVVGFVFCFTCIYTLWTFLQTPLFGAKQLDTTLDVWAISYNISFLYGAMSIGSRLAYDWQMNQKKNKALLLQKTTTQIQLMKSNVNMPFLLKVLDYSEKISKDKPQQIEQPIMLLSDVLRYGLYESESLSISVTKEIAIIEEYMELQKLVAPLVSTPLIVKGNVQHALIVPNVLLRIISSWRALIDTAEEAIEHPVRLHYDGSNIMLLLHVNSINHDKLYQLEKSIHGFSNDHLTIMVNKEDNTWQLTIHTILL